MHLKVLQTIFQCLKAEYCSLRSSGSTESLERHKQNSQWNLPAGSENRARALNKIPRQHLLLTSRWNPAAGVRSSLGAPDILIRQKPYIARSIPVFAGVPHFVAQR